MKINLCFLKNKTFYKYLLGVFLTGLIISMILTHRDWRTARRDSAGIAPAPSEVSEAVVQVYAARTINWRGYLSVHSWIATKEKDADFYVTYQVMGWNLYFSGNAVVVKQDIPDRYWYGSKPELIEEIRGEKAERAIPKIIKYVNDYPYKTYYNVWPGPNSNSFIANIIRNTPELTVELPPHAIGKDWINKGDFFGNSESGSGYQLSLWGLFGITIGKAEGIEVNLLGMTFGIDFYRPALKLPFIGRIGIKDSPLNKK